MELTADNLSGVETHLHGLGWIEPGERLRSLSPAGEGNMNRTLRARFDTRSLVLKQAVPFVARYPHIAAPIERLDVEAAFYRHVSAYPGLTRWMPRLHGYDPAAHLLCLEDLGSEGDFTSGYRPGGSTVDKVPVATLGSWLGGLHDVTVDARLARCFDNQAMRELNHAHIFEIPLRPDNGLDPLPGTGAVAAAFTVDRPLKKAAAALGRVYLAGSAADAGLALLHGDFYPGSWLRTADGQGVRIIDPEFAFVGAPEFDLGVWLAHLRLLGFEEPERSGALHAYPRLDRVDMRLVSAFAGIEVIRRLLGVARLGLQASDRQLHDWLVEARKQVCA